MFDCFYNGVTDIDTVDNMLGDSLRMFFATMASILGAIILIAIVLPWFLIAVASITMLYIWAAMFYRASARELKRLGTHPLPHMSSDMTNRLL